MQRGVVIVLLDVRLDFSEHFLGLSVSYRSEFIVGRG
jgi:hypothetical protein